MAELVVTTREGETRPIPATLNDTIMEIIRAAGIGELLALCGGVCSCATCHVHVDPAFADRLPPMSEDEKDLLEYTTDFNETSRLSCQIRFTDALDGLRVRIAQED